MIKSEGIATVCKQYKTNGISECSTESTYEPIENYEAGYAPVDHSVIENYVIKNTVYDLPLAQCKVYTVTNESSEKFILKVIEKDGLSQMMTAKAREECVIQSQLQHENIAKLHHYSETPTTIELVMEHCNQYSYFEERLEENSDPIEDGVKLKKYVTEILRALEYIHSKGIVHADIKLANICLHKDSDGEETIKLIDFGLSLVTNAQNNGKAYMKSPIGTLGYMAPEIKGKDIIVGPEIDMWAFGIVLYKMCVGYTPTQVPHFSYGNGPIPFVKRDWRKLDSNLQDLISKWLEVDPHKRISSSDALKHAALE